MASKRNANAPKERVRVRFARGQRGSVAAEYVIMLAIMGALIAVGALGLGNAISAAMGRSAKCMEKSYDGPLGRENPCAKAPDKEDS